MKKKLLFLVVCALLLLCATAAPASARDTYPTPAYPPYWYNVDCFGWGAYWVDEVAHTAGGPVRAVPAGSPVYVGSTWICATYGQSVRQAAAMLQRLEVWTYDKDGSKSYVLAPIDESISQSYWVGPYDVNTAYGHDYAPHNPEVQSGIWGMDWVVALGPLAKGTYWFTYSELRTHSISDPHFEATPVFYPAYDRTNYGTYSFKVR